MAEFNMPLLDMALAEMYIMEEEVQKQRKLDRKLQKDATRKAKDDRRTAEMAERRARREAERHEEAARKAQRRQEKRAAEALLPVEQQEAINQRRAQKEAQREAARLQKEAARMQKDAEREALRVQKEALRAEKEARYAAMSEEEKRVEDERRQQKAAAKEAKEARRSEKKKTRKPKKEAHKKKSKPPSDVSTDSPATFLEEDDMVLTDTDGFTSITFRCGEHLENRPAGLTLNELMHGALAMPSKSGDWDAELLAWSGPFFALKCSAIPSSERSSYFFYFHLLPMPLSVQGNSPAPGPLNIREHLLPLMSDLRLVLVESTYEHDKRIKGRGLRLPFGQLATIHEKALLATDQPVPADLRTLARQKDRDFERAMEAKLPKNHPSLAPDSFESHVAANVELFVPSLKLYSESATPLIKAIMFLIIKARSGEYFRNEIYFIVLSLLTATQYAHASAPADKKEALSHQLRRAWEILAICPPFFVPSHAGVFFLLQFLRFHILQESSLDVDELPMISSASNALMNPDDDDLLLEEGENPFTDDDQQLLTPPPSSSSSSASTSSPSAEQPVITGSSSDQVFLNDCQNLSKMAQQYALFILRRLRRCIARGPRKAAVTPSEYTSTIRRQHARLRVHLLDGTCVLLFADSSSTLSELIAELVERIGLQESRGWAMYELQTQYDNVIERSLSKNEKILDEIWVLETSNRSSDVSAEDAVEFKSVQSSDKKSSDKSSASEDLDSGAENDDRQLPFQSAKNSQTALVFKRKLFLTPRAPPSGQVEAQLSAYQAREQFLRGRFPCSRDDLIKLGALLLHHTECAAFSTSGSHLSDIDIASCLPKTQIMSSLLSDEGWKSLLRAQYQSLHLKDEAPQTALLRFYSEIQNHPLFGFEFFRVSHRSEWHLPPQFYFGIGLDGIKFVDGATGNILFEHQHAGLLFNGDALKAHFYFLADGRQPGFSKGALVSITLMSDESPEIQGLLRDYQNWLKYYSTVAIATRAHPSPEDLRVLSEREGIVDPQRILNFSAKDQITIVQRCSRFRFIGSLPNGTTGSFHVRAVRVQIPAMNTTTPQFIPATPRSLRRERSATLNAHRAESRFRTQLIHFSDELNAFELLHFAQEHFRKSPFVKAAEEAKATKSAFGRVFKRKASTPLVTAAVLQPYDLPLRVKFSPQLLPDSLMELANADLNAAAIDANRRLLKWMSTLPLDRNETAAEQLQQLIESVVYADDPNFVIEVYVQVMKQTTDNPTLESIIRGWQALHFLISCRLPPDILRRYLFGHLQIHSKDAPEIAAWVSACRTAIGRNLQRGPRHGAPSCMEIELLIAPPQEEKAGTPAKRLGEMHLPIILRDGQCLNVPVDSSCIISEVVDQVCMLLDFAPTYPDAWTLFHVCSTLNINRPLLDTDFVFDELRRAELHIVPKGTTRPGLSEWEFSFRCRFYIGNPKVPQVKTGRKNDPTAVNDTELKLVYWGTYCEILSSQLVLEQHKLFDVAANHVIVLRGPQSTEPISFDDLKSFIPKRVITSSPNIDFRGELQSRLQTLQQRHQSDVSAMQESLEYLMSLPMFGAAVWPVHRAVRTKGQQSAQPCVLAVNGNGIHVAKRLTREPLAYFPYHRVNKWQVSGPSSAVKIMVQTDEGVQQFTTLLFQPKSKYAAKQIVTLISRYIEFLVARSREAEFIEELEPAIPLSSSSSLPSSSNQPCSSSS